MRYARRDQLSANVAFRAAGIQPLPLPIDHYESEFHSWPRSRARDSNGGGRNLAVSLMPLPGRLRLAETRLQAAETARKACEMEIGSLREQLVKVSAAHAELSAAHVELSAARESLLHSTSWRLTEPLRRLVRWFRGDVTPETAGPQYSPTPPL
jgi:hypothetical protein